MEVGQPLPASAVVSPEALVVTLGQLDVGSLRQARRAVEELECRLRDHEDGIAEISRGEVLRAVEAIEQLLRAAAPGLAVDP